ncbi:MAG: HAMP domain-containing sensor histidine kinase [Acidobacteriota bacterium]
MSEASPRRFRWHHRLSVKLGLLVAGALLIFELFCDDILNVAFQLFGLGPLDQQIVVLPDEDMVVELSAQADQLADALFAAHSGEGDWSPSATASQSLSQILEYVDEGFVLVDPSRRIVARSDNLPFQVGSPWTEPRRPLMRFAIPGERRTARAVSVPAGPPGRPRGWLVYTWLDPPLSESDASLSAEGDLVLEDEEFQALAEREVKVFWIARGAILGIIVAVIAIAISRGVTRRLSRLAVQAAAPLGSGGEPPGPFEVEGNDEIALLATTMNDLRDRVGELVGNIQDQDARRREWVAHVSHDLRTPLTALLACFDRADRLLDEKDGDELRDEVERVLSVARLDASRVHELAVDLLEISRLDTEADLSFEPVPPGEIVRQSVRSLSALAELEEKELVVKVDNGLPLLEADGRRVMRAMENLLRNALQHAKTRVEAVVQQAPSGHLHFEVRDDGPGLPVGDGPVTLSGLSSRRSRSDSAGLGLMVARRVAEAHGGSIGGRNLDEGGAAVWFELPVWT